MARLIALSRRGVLLPQHTDRWQALAALTFAGMCALPIALVFISSVAPRSGHTLAAVQLGLAAVGGSIATAGASTVVGGLLGALVGESVRRSSGVPARALRMGVLLPLAVPPVVVALGIRALLESAGLEAVVRGEAGWLASTLPVVLAHATVALAIVAWAWSSLRPGRDDAAMRARDEAARLLGLSPFQRWRMVDQPDATRTLVLGSTLGFLHAFTSLAAPMIFPRSGLASLPLLLHRGIDDGVNGIAAALPLMVTLPLLAVAWRAREVAPVIRRDGDQPSAASPLSPWLAPGLVVVGLLVIAPLAAVLARGFSPAALGALLRGDGTALGAAFGGSVLLGCVAAVGALTPLAYLPLSVPGRLRGGAAAWVLLGVAPAVLAALAYAGADPGRWLLPALLVHFALGHAAGLPALAMLIAVRTRGADDAARVLGADGLQPVIWDSRGALLRAVGAAAVLGALVSIGDVATLFPATEPSARTLSQAIPVLLETTEGAAAGAFAVASMLVGLAVAALFALQCTGASGEAIWSRR